MREGGNRQLPRRCLGSVPFGPAAQHAGRRRSAAPVRHDRRNLPERERAGAPEIQRNVEARREPGCRRGRRGLRTHGSSSTEPAGRGGHTSSGQRACRPALRRNPRRSRRYSVSKLKRSDRPGDRALEARRAFVVAEQPISDAERKGIHRTRWRHADLPVTEARQDSPAPWSCVPPSRTSMVRHRMAKCCQKPRSNAAFARSHRSPRSAADSRDWFRCPTIAVSASAWRSFAQRSGAVVTRHAR